jgi:DNA-binding NarL/FixJ family response regulator
MSKPAPAPSMGSKKRQILVVDDHPIVRQGLSMLIEHEPDIEICGTAEDVAGAMELVKATRPDLVVVDISLKASHGLDLIAQIKKFDKRIKVLVWSMFDEALFAERAMRAGAAGYINKQEAIEKVVEAIRRVLNGEIHLSPRMNSHLLGHIDPTTHKMKDDPVATLSNRELQVLEMIGGGMTTQQMAERLKLSPKTVEGYRENIKKKLGLKNTAELSRRAFQWVLEQQ